MRDTNILTDNGINVQQSLELFGDMEMYDETLGDFLDMSDEKITTLENYKNANDMPNYAIAVHALKSDARYLGFTTLADLSYESEMKSKAGDSVFVQENHPKILVEAKRVINLAQQYMGRELTEVIPATAAVASAPAEAQPAPVMESTPAPVQTDVAVQSPISQEVPMQQEAQVVYQPQETSTVMPTQEVAPVAQPMYAEPTQVVAPQPVVQQSSEAQVVYQQQVAPVMPAQEVAPVAQQMYAEPTQVVAPQPVVQQSPEAQVVYQQQVAPAMPAQEVAPVAQQMYAEPTQVVTPQPVVQQSPAAEQKETIQFFPADDYQQQDIMSQALYMQQQAQTVPQVGAVKKGIILVVDDSPLVANFVKKIFSANYDVIIANDGQKAIETINDENIRSKIKTCLLDLNMPNVSGFDVMDHFREKGFFVRTPVAVISGAEDEETLDKVKGYPIVDILAKPFNERDVQRVVEKCLAVYF